MPRHVARLSMMERKETAVRWLDWIAIAGIAGLIVATPLAIGSINPWPLCAVEVTIFLLTIVFMVRIAVARTPQAFPGLHRVLTPAALFIALALFQLLPLPPPIQRVISPATYRLFETSLAGWPDRDPYPRLRDTGSRGKGSASQGAEVRAPADPTDASNADYAPRSAFAHEAMSRWRPLSIAPVLTKTVALELIAYGCLFFIILCYPLRKYPHPYGERRFCRQLLQVVLVSGLVVGCIGLLEMALWNGKVMWVYTPYDWGSTRPEFIDRAQGPFVNPDHFAAYLNLILPLALAAPPVKPSSAAVEGPSRCIHCACCALRSHRS
jgi:hypothetical protein